MKENIMMQRILVWDIPTRFFHWALALSFTGAYLTAETERYRDIHIVLGYTLLGLIVFRLLWGFTGSRYARFNSFLFKPVEIVTYLRSLLERKPQHYLGHNPAGSVAIFLMLGLSLLAGVSGILLYQEVGGEMFEDFHEGAANFMLAVVFIHIAGVIVSSWLHRENLVRSMITGFKNGEASQGIRNARALTGAILLALVVAFWVWYPQTGLVAPVENASAVSQSYDSD
jgi:cytochrome b